MGASFFLILNAFVVFFLVSRIISFALNRGKPTLNNKGGQKPQSAFKMEFFDVFSQATKPQEKSLNCLFQFEGITRDAFEVLGVPAGAPREVCQAAYRDLIRHESGERKKLLESAINALGFS